MMSILHTLWVLRNTIILILTPILLSPLLMNGSTESTAGFCLILMAVYWATEALPIAVTALLPVMLFPMLGLMTGKEVSKQYINDSSMLFVGGLIMAVAIEHRNIHKRIALRILLWIGTQPSRLMFGMMLPSWFLSMWTSNMATTAMMCPIADALLKELASSQGSHRGNGTPAQQITDTDKTTNDDIDNPAYADNVAMEIKVADDTDSSDQEETAEKVFSKEHLQLAKAMTISIAYAANIGGTTTITGCASNIILKGLADETFNARGIPSGISFGTWLVFGFPLSLVIFLFLFLWLHLYFRGFRCSSTSHLDSDRVRTFVKREYQALGPMRFPELTVICLFILLILLWVSRDMGGAGGWGSLFKSKYVTDSAAPTLVTVLLFLIPSNLPDFFRKDGRPITAPALLTWRAVHEKLPWGLFLLFGGGFALAEGCKVSGLSNSIREALTAFKDLPSWATCFLVAFLVSMVTEVVTNTATCTLVLPIIAQLALSIDVNPLYLMIPTAVATSYAYMLPVATPPNAMVYVLGYFTKGEMARAGFVMNFMSIVFLTLAVNTIGSAYFGLNTLPDAFKEQVGMNMTSSVYANLTTPTSG